MLQGLAVGTALWAGWGNNKAKVVAAVKRSPATGLPGTGRPPGVLYLRKDGWRPDVWQAGTEFLGPGCVWPNIELYLALLFPVTDDGQAEEQKPVVPSQLGITF
jgi:hypothetical protein